MSIVRLCIAVCSHTDDCAGAAVWAVLFIHIAADALVFSAAGSDAGPNARFRLGNLFRLVRSEEHTSELQSLMRISYAVFCLKKKIHSYTRTQPLHHTPP